MARMIDPLLVPTPIPQPAAASECIGQLPGTRRGYRDTGATVGHAHNRAL